MKQDKLFYYNDENLAAVVPELMKLDSREYNRLLLNLSLNKNS